MVGLVGLIFTLIFGIVGIYFFRRRKVGIIFVEKELINLYDTVAKNTRM